MFRWWRIIQRRQDLTVLWPAIRDQAPTLDVAKAAFAAHVFNDTAWTKDYTHDELVSFVGAME